MALYAEHGPALRSFARRLVGDPHAAEDLVHDVFVALPGALKNFQGRGSMSAFLRGMAVNQARRHVRTAARRRAAMDRLARETEATARVPAAQVEQRDLARRLSAAMDALPLPMRAAFVLCEIEELSSSEAAVILGVPAATVRTRVARARGRLREHLGGDHA